MRSLLRAVLTASLLAAAASPAPAAAPPPLGVQTVTYDVAHLLARPGKTGSDSIEALVATLTTTIAPKSWGAAGKGGSTLREVNGNRLEVTATPARHAEIAQLLGALARMSDVAVDLRAVLYEVDRTLYEKELAPRLRRGAATQVEQEVLDLVCRRGARLGSNKVRLGNREEALLLSRRKAFTYVTRPQPVGVGLFPEPLGHGIAWTGARFRAHVTVSGDRRFVDVRLIQDVAELREMTRKRVWIPDKLVLGFVDVPNLARSARTDSIEVADGMAFMVPVVAPLEGGKRVRVLVVQPLIWIEEEERERERAGR